jgi:hypothetical protein
LCASIVPVSGWSRLVAMPPPPSVAKAAPKIKSSGLNDLGMATTTSDLAVPAI